MRFSEKKKGINITTNYEGEVAYKLTPKMELYTLVCTASLQKKFYTDEDECINRLKTLLPKVPIPFAAKLAVYAREEMHLRSIPLVIAVELLKLERMAEKSVDNILNAIEKSKGTPLPRVIFALGIRHVGEQMAELLAKHFGSMDRLASASREELLSVPTVGPKIADSIITFFRQKENRRIIERLKNAGVRLEEEVAAPGALPLAGQEFVITGRLNAFTRDEAETRIKSLGGTTKDNVTRKTNYVVVGADPGSKLARAQALGIKQLTEEEFIRLLNEVG